MVWTRKSIYRQVSKKQIDIRNKNGVEVFSNGNGLMLQLNQKEQLSAVPEKKTDFEFVIDKNSLLVKSTNKFVKFLNKNVHISKIKDATYNPHCHLYIIETNKIKKYLSLNKKGDIMIVKKPVNWYVLFQNRAVGSGITLEGKGPLITYETQQKLQKISEETGLECEYYANMYSNSMVTLYFHEPHRPSYEITDVWSDDPISFEWALKDLLKCLRSDKMCLKAENNKKGFFDPLWFEYNL
jgi:hypothetical protein